MEQTRGSFLAGSKLWGFARDFIDPMPNSNSQDLGPPEALKTIFDRMLSELDAIPPKEFKQGLVELKSSEFKEYVEMTNKFHSVISRENNVELEPLFKKLNTKPYERQFSRVSDHPRMKKIMEGLCPPEVQVEYEEYVDRLEHPEAKALAKTMFGKFQLLPKEKSILAKVWDAIKNLFQKIFCCCKKKDVKTEVLATSLPVEVRNQDQASNVIPESELAATVL